MPANLENSAVATGLEKVSFHSNPKERECQSMFKERKWSHSVMPDFCDPMGYGPPGSSARGIFQARILEQVAISFSRRSSQPRDQTQVSCIAGRFFTTWATREALINFYLNSNTTFFFYTNSVCLESQFAAFIL